MSQHRKHQSGYSRSRVRKGPMDYKTRYVKVRVLRRHIHIENTARPFSDLPKYSLALFSNVAHWDDLHYSHEYAACVKFDGLRRTHADVVALGVALALFRRPWLFPAHHRMSTVVLLSSSPPQVFSKSPKPFRSSSPLPSPNAIFRGDPDLQKPFKSADFECHGISSARNRLGIKVGAETVPLQPRAVPAASKPARGPQRGNKPPSREEIARRCRKPVAKTDAEQEKWDSAFASQKHGVGTKSIDAITLENHSKDEVLGSDEKALSPAIAAPPNNGRIIHTRRLDWTPPRTTMEEADLGDSANVTQKALLRESFGNFSYAAPAADVVAWRYDSDVVPTKRRRIEVLETNVSRAGSLSSKDTSRSDFRAKTGEKLDPVAGRKVKSSKKKYTTITERATSLHAEAEEAGRQTPIMRYVTAAQAQATADNGGQSDDNVKTKPKQRGGAAAKRAKQIPALLSPHSALKHWEAQEAMFGSASQFAKDDSLSSNQSERGLKEPDVVYLSDPVSTQITEPISIESTTPRVSKGTLRFVKTRNLWCAAGRDEDNALLHVDSIDMFDTPDMRAAFAGKDALVTSGGRKMRPSEVPWEEDSPSLREDQFPTPSLGEPCIDIDDLRTPAHSSVFAGLPVVQARSAHSMAQPTTKPTATLSHSHTAKDTGKGMGQVPKTTIPETKSTKPSFIGFTMGDLQKQIQAYGFKPIKRREKMIEILDKCWESKHVVSKCMAPETELEEDTRSQAVTFSHGDFLSKVHDLNNRPRAKVKKPRAPRKKAVDSAAIPKPKPKPRSKGKTTAANSVGNESIEAKQSQKRKTADKISSLSEERIVDVDDIEDSTVETPANLEKSIWDIDDIIASTTTTETNSSRPTAGPKQPTRQTNLGLTTKQVAVEIPSSPSPAIEPPSTGLSPLMTQIHRAITSYRAPASHNHQREPTWHEKILLYDPIVLEDLASWLNTTGFKAIGEDREVGAVEVREWCEREGVCCLWRGGWRGNSTAGARGKGLDG